MAGSRNGMRHGIRLSTASARQAQDAVGLAVAAEESGWDGIFVSDSIMFGFSDPWTVLASIAARTERVRLGTWVTPVSQLQPWRLANTIATLDQLSGGRVMLGAGLGVDREHEMFGDPYARDKMGRKYDEALEVMTRLWSGEPVTFRGEFFTLNDVTLPITPVQKPRVPILIAGWWPNRKAFRRAAQWDGIMPYWPALLGDGVGPEGQKPTGASVEDELRDMMAYYRSLTDNPGEVVLPRERRDWFDDLAGEVGATWLLSSYTMDEAEIRQGPPR